MDYLWWGEYQQIRSVHKHCNWHLHQVKQYWLIRKEVRTFMLMLHSSTKHRCSMLKLKVCSIPVSLTLYFLSVWHNTNSKYNSNPSYFHKIPLQQSRHSDNCERSEWANRRPAFSPFNQLELDNRHRDKVCKLFKMTFQLFEPLQDLFRQSQTQILFLSYL